MSAVIPDHWMSQLCTARPRLLRLARRLTRNRADAEDLVQDTMLKGITCVSSFRGSSLIGWLYTIAKNAWFTEHRSRKFHASVKEQLPVPDPHEDTYDIVADSEMREAFERIKATLPADQSAVLEGFLDGMSYLELAAAHGVAIGTIRSRLSRARERLQGIRHE